MDGWMMDGWMGWIDGWMGWIDGWMDDGWMDGMDDQIDGMDACIFPCLPGERYLRLHLHCNI